MDKDNREEAFLKAVDLFKKQRINGGSPADVLLGQEESIRSFRYEAELLELCGDRRMDRVVRALDSGIFEVPISEYSIAIQVPFIVFELAQGDLRTHPDRVEYNLAWRLRVFHGVAVAMRQLHMAKIAHQDMKPSNVLVFDRDFSKIGDLGRATRQEEPSKYEGDNHMGDNNYIPFELLYGQTQPMPWEDRRFGADLFMMGCVLTYLLTDSSFLVLTLDKLERQFWPSNTRDYSAALPHLQRAVENVLQEIQKHLPEAVADELVSLIYRLVDPDFTKRGFPKSCSGGTGWRNQDSVLSRFDLQQVVSRLEVMVRRAQLDNLSSTPINDDRSFLDFFHNR